LIGFLIELPEPLEGRVQSNGIEIAVMAMVEVNRARSMRELDQIRDK
jgi:hypothetical protein